MVKCYAFLVACLLSVFTMVSQVAPSDSSHKKTIGLVLSGGGAKGMAHIGLLKLIDSLNLNVSFVGGTSMGSIMGTLYSIGYSGIEIETRCRNMAWNHLFSDRIPFNKITIEEKMDQNRYLLELPFKKGRLKLPAGVISGPNLYNEFVKLSFPVIDKPNWDSFPIPLRINAVNILNGANVVFHSGFLPPRMRASMSIPSIFMPIEVDTCYFVDGGVVRNILIPEVKASKPDVMIGSYTGGALMSMDELNTLPKLMGQTFTIYGILDAMNEEKELNFISKPDLRGLDAGSFAKAGLIIERGIASANRLRDTLATLAKNPAYQRRKPIAQAHDDVRLLNESFEVGQITARGIEKTTFHFFTSVLGVHAGDSTNLKTLFDGVTKLYGSMHYDFVTYNMEFKGYASNGRKIIDLHFALNESPDLAVRFAVNHNSDISTSLVVGILGRNILIKNTRLVFEAGISEKPRAKFSYLWYADKRMKWLLGTTNFYAEDEIGSFNQKVTEETFRLKQFYSYNWLQYKFSNKHGLSLGYEYIARFLKPKIYSNGYYDLIRNLTTNQHSALLMYQYNTLNRQALPTHGLSITAKAHYVFSSLTKAHLKKNVDIPELSGNLLDNFYNYPKFALSAEHYQRLNKRFTWIRRFYGSAMFFDKTNNNDYYVIGSMDRNTLNAIPLYGYRFGEFLNNTFAIAEGGLQANVMKELYLSTGLQVAQLSNSYSEFFRHFTDASYKGDLYRTSSFYGSVAYLVPRLGPVSFSVHKSFDRNLWFTYLSIGYRFPVL